ncbi:hypothetical protein ABTX35_18985 [Streptomyces sp. NPDC096080]|uniref:hypothetical protein n=1 Tax=Streptomyces sp. NPDC096080 TaxID=3156693 RepID=UPI00332A617B
MTPPIPEQRPADDEEAQRAELEAAKAAIKRVRERCCGVRDRNGAGGMINASQILGLLSPTWPDGNYEAPATLALDGTEPTA